MDRWMDRWMDGWIDGWMDGRLDGWMYAWIVAYGWLKRRMDRCLMEKYDVVVVWTCRINNIRCDGC